jgi:DNA-binding NarL/FixJ family response regulator
MTSVMIVADNGADMARLTASVKTVRGMEIVRHASGHAPVARLVAAHGPALVLIGELSPRSRTFERVREVRAAAPDSAVIVVAAAAGARWLPRALQAGATAALPGEQSTPGLASVLEEVLASDLNAAPVALAA